MKKEKGNNNVDTRNKSQMYEWNWMLVVIYYLRNLRITIIHSVLKRPKKSNTYVNTFV